MAKATIVAQGTRPETYADVLAAIAVQFPKVNEVDFVTLGDLDIKALLPKIQEIGATRNKYPGYQRSFNFKKTFRKADPSLEFAKTGILVDVTAIGKEQAVQVAIAHLGGAAKVCTLSWEKFDPINLNVIGRDAYRYYDILSSGSVSRIRRGYISRMRMIYLMGAIFLALVLLGVPSYLGYDLIPEKIVSLMSMLMGAAGLWLAYETIKRSTAA